MAAEDLNGSTRTAQIRAAFRSRFRTLNVNPVPLNFHSDIIVGTGCIRSVLLINQQQPHQRQCTVLTNEPSTPRTRTAVFAEMLMTKWLDV